MTRSTSARHNDIVTWMCDNIEKYNDRRKFFADCMDETGVGKRAVQRTYKQVFNPQNLHNPDILEDHRDSEYKVKESSDVKDYELQKSLDISRIERKDSRELYRIHNVLETLGTEIVRLLEQNKFHQRVHNHIDTNFKAGGIVHLTDLHLNELVNILGNQYDFTVASKRLSRFVEIAHRHFQVEKIKNVLVAFTGDILNSDRRLDEVLSQATNRAKAVFLAVELLQQLLLELNEHYNLTVVSVSGNESRLPKDIGWTTDVLTDNYDFLVHNILKRIFTAKQTTGIQFLDGSFGETVVSVAGQNILLLHGLSLKTETEKEVARLIGRYAAKGIKISYVLYGHLHSARVGDVYAKGSSLVGANAYSEDGLNLIGRASQNIFIVRSDGNIDGMKISLQNVENNKGYVFDSSLEAYNIKSADKCHKPEVIFEVVI